MLLAACLGCSGVDSYNDRETPGLIAGVPTHQQQTNNVTAVWVSGPFNLSGYTALSLKFPEEQAGVKFYLQILPKGFSENDPTGLSRTEFVVPQGGIIEISLKDVLVDFKIHPDYLRSIGRIVVHSGQGPVFDVGHFLDQAPSSIATFKSITGLTSASSPAIESPQTSDVSLQTTLTTDDGRLTTKPGGIDLNPALLDLQIKRDGEGVPLPLPQQPIETMRIDGFLPVIINIVPITNLPLLLGLDLLSPEQKPVQLTYQELSLAVTPGKERFCMREQEEIFV